MHGAGLLSETQARSAVECLLMVLESLHLCLRNCLMGGRLQSTHSCIDVCRVHLLCADWLEPAQVALRPVFQHAVQLISTLIKDSVKIQLDLDDDIPDVLGDEGRIQQVLTCGSFHKSHTT